jgi:hypothetical protein
MMHLAGEGDAPGCEAADTERLRLEDRPPHAEPEHAAALAVPVARGASLLGLVAPRPLVIRASRLLTAAD